MNTQKNNIFDNSLIYLSLSLLFVLFLIGWHQGPGLFIWGLYTDIDGQLAAWYGKTLFQWSTPFSMSNINPFEGLGTLFFLNNVWVNPGALALSLPLEEIWTYVVSYGIYLIEVSISVYFLARALNLSRLQSVLAIQVFAFFLFPPFTAWTHSLSFFSAAPFNAHLMALCNFALILFVKLNQGSSLSKLIKSSLIIVLVFMGIYSGLMTILTYIPCYGIFTIGIVAQDLSYSPKKMDVFLWRIGTFLTLLGLIYFLGVFDYIIDTSKYVARSLATDLNAETSLSLIEQLKIILQKIRDFNFSARPQWNLFHYSTHYPIAVLHTFAALGGLLGCFVQKYRWIAASFLCIALLPDFLITLIETRLFLKLSLISPSFYLWSAYSFYPIFFMIFLTECWNILKRVLHLNSFIFNLKEKTSRSWGKFIFKETWLVFVIPLVALGVFKGIKLYTSVPIQTAEKTKIIEHIENATKLQPGALFRGTTMAYLGSIEGGIRPNLDGQGDLFGVGTYTCSRDYLKKTYNNWHMFSDLWKYDIPTLEEYGQWVALPLFVFYAEMLSKPGAQFCTSNLNVYHLDYNVLKLLGTRFIVSDIQLDNPKVMQVEKLVKEGAAPLYLYEIENPNVGNYSPTKITYLDSAHEIFNLWQKEEFDFENSVVLQKESIPEKLSKAHDAKISFDANTIRAEAKSDGYSILVLPVQFSNCYRINNKIPDSTVKIMRANMVLTGIFFKDILDVELLFDFGITRNTQCREQDIKEIEALGLKDGSYTMGKLNSRKPG